MKKIGLLIVLLIITVLISSDVGAQVLTFSLEEAQQYAVENNYNVRSAELDYQIAEKKVKETMALGFPQIDANMDYNYFLVLPTSLIPGDFVGQPGEDIELQFGKPNNLNIGVQLNQLIFDGRYFIGLQYSKIYKQLSERGIDRTERDIKALVAQTYYNILVGLESVVILDSTLTVLTQTRYETGEMYKEGFAEETDYDQLTLTITDIENSRNSMARQTEIAFDLLKFQMGIPIETEITLKQTLNDVLMQINLEAVASQQFNINNNVDYQMITTQEQMKQLNLRNEKAAYWPSINGFFSATYNAQREGFNFTAGGYPWFPSTSVGFNMNIPIFSSGIRKSRVGMAKLELEQLQNNKSQLEESLRLDVVQARSAFNTALENFYREEQSVELSLKIYRKTLIKYREGVATSVELTQQHNQFFNAESNYFQTVLILLNAKNELDKTLGNY